MKNQRSAFKSPFLLTIFFLSEILTFSFFLLASDLPEKYRKWLEEEVVYIITPKEREVFLQLKTDRERDIFIEAFWKQRDPTPGTPRNEFREEHYRRLNYANQFFGRGTGKPGWKTDQGRIYIILGPPNNIEKYENIMGVYPAQVWFYYGDPRYGLPAGFNIIFFKKEGTGEYILYSPSDHGPQALVADYMYNARDARDAYQRLYQLAPNLAEQSLSLIPNERTEPGVIDLASNKLLASIFSLPQRRVEDAYAEAWFKYKDLIEVDYSANYIRSDYQIWAVQKENGNYLIHYAVEPAKISVEEDNQGYLVRFDFNGRISDEQGRTIYQFEKSLPLVLTRDQLAEIGKRAVSFQDVFPLLPGTYTFDLLLKNPLSKEFSSFTQKINLPHRLTTPQLGQILLAYDYQEISESETLFPFQMGKNQILTQSRKSYTSSESLVACLQIRGMTEELEKKARLKIDLLRENQSVLTKEKSLEDLKADSLVVEKIPLSAFSPGYYTLAVYLLLDGQIKDSKKAELEISSLTSIPRPIIVSKARLTAAEEDFIIGLQLLNSGHNKEALQTLARAFSLNPGIKQALAYSEALYRMGEYQKIISILEPLEQSQSSGEILSLLGRSYHALNQFARAAVYYEQYLEHSGANYEILNYLGTCYYQLGDKDKALAVWEKSLSLNPEQEKLRELINSIKKNLDHK